MLSPPRSPALWARTPRPAAALRLLVALAAIGMAAFAPTASAQQPANPYGAHSMVYAYSMPLAQKEQAFAQAKAMGASQIRLDLEMPYIFTRWHGNVRREWSGVDQVRTLSRRYDLPVLAVLTGVPTYLSACSDREATRCAAADPAAYGELAGVVARHLQGAISLFEILNEPDTSLMFRGSPEDYARMLASAHDEIRSQAPDAQVVLGGVSEIGARTWLSRVFATPGVAASTKFEIAGVHIRGGVGSLAGTMKLWRAYFNAAGRADAPLWVTEHGYPADTADQYDGSYRGGEAAQAAFLRDSLPTLLRAGAQKVFVPTRDNWPGEFGEQSPFHSEGVATLSRDAPYSVRQKPAEAVVRTLAAEWPKVPHTVGELARLTAARNANAAQGAGLTTKRDALDKRARDLRRAITRLRHRLRHYEGTHHPRQVRSLRRKLRGSLQKLATVKVRRSSADRDAAARFLQVRAYQALLSAG